MEKRLRVPSFALRAMADKRLRMAGCQLLAENLKNCNGLVGCAALPLAHQPN